MTTLVVRLADGTQRTIQDKRLSDLTGDRWLSTTDGTFVRAGDVIEVVEVIGGSAPDEELGRLLDEDS